MSNLDGHVAVKSSVNQCYAAARRRNLSDQTLNKLVIVYLIYPLRTLILENDPPLQPSELVSSYSELGASLLSDKVYAIVGLF